MNYFDNWFKQFAREKPVIPEKPTDETWSRMEIQEKASFELQHKQLSEAKYRHEAATKFLFEVKHLFYNYLSLYKPFHLDCQ